MGGLEGIVEELGGIAPAVIVAEDKSKAMKNAAGSSKANKRSNAKRKWVENRE